MAHWAANGVRCECVDDGVWVSIDTGNKMRGPEKGERLTVAYVERRGDMVIIGFEKYGNGRLGFDASSFRPLTQRDSDLAMFRAIADAAARQNSIHVSEPA